MTLGSALSLANGSKSVSAQGRKINRFVLIVVIKSSRLDEGSVAIVLLNVSENKQAEWT